MWKYRAFTVFALLLFCAASSLGAGFRMSHGPGMLGFSYSRPGLRVNAGYLYGFSPSPLRFPGRYPVVPPILPPPIGIPPVMVPPIPFTPAPTSSPGPDIPPLTLINWDEPRQENGDAKKSKEDALERFIRRRSREDSPRESFERLVAEGQDAFRKQEYGLAALRFRRAREVRPAQPGPWFLLAQALLAQGKYHEAQDALLEGLARKPDWPTSGFRPLELYDEALEYSAHLEALEDAVRRHPLDPVLLFLYGYALWFDGRPGEASVFLRQSAARGMEHRWVDRFLLALPAGGTL